MRDGYESSTNKKGNILRVAPFDFACSFAFIIDIYMQEAWKGWNRWVAKFLDASPDERTKRNLKERMRMEIWWTGEWMNEREREREREIESKCTDIGNNYDCYSKSLGLS